MRTALAALTACLGRLVATSSVERVGALERLGRSYSNAVYKLTLTSPEPSLTRESTSLTATATFPSMDGPETP